MKLRQIVREELEARFPRKLKTQSKIILNGKGFEGISEEQMSAWKAAYPLVDLRECLSLGWAWCVSNPEKAPKSNYGRFLNTWLRKTQNARSAQEIPRPESRKVKCRSCGSGSWISISGGRCERCRE